MKYILLAGALMTVAMAVAVPASAQASVYVIGDGNSSCATLVANNHSGAITDISDLAAREITWVLGFLSGVGWMGTLDPLNGVDAQAVATWLTGYCRTHPLDTIVVAASAFAYAHPR